MQCKKCNDAGYVSRAIKEPFGKDGFIMISKAVKCDCRLPIHVYPLNDLKEHHTAASICWCNPRKEENDMLIIHNSADGREEFERSDRKMS